MSIWFRIKYCDGDKYDIYCKIGKTQFKNTYQEVQFKSVYQYTLDELPDAIKSLSELDMENDGE